MFSGKGGIIQEVSGILERADYETLLYENSCFDIIAKKADGSGQKMIFLKALLNIDSLPREHASDMKIISNVTGSFTGLVGMQTRYESMRDDVVYERFGIAAFTPGLLEKMVIHNQFPFLFRDKGGIYMEVSHEKLRSAREEKGLTQEKLAKKLGVTKKSVYEHEKQDMRMLLPQARKADYFLEQSISCSFNFDSWKYDHEKSSPKTAVEREVYVCFRRMGFDTSCVRKSPFNLIAKEKKHIFAHAEKRLPEKRMTEELKNLSEIAKSPVLVVAEEECKDLPSIRRKKLKKIETRDEFYDLLKRL
jgi:putative transcriptional regulator